MFHATGPRPSARAELRALRLSLNKPVVAIDELPVGPATAAIAVHAGPGGPELTLLVRSERSGAVVFFRPGHDEPSQRGAEFAIDAACSFAERMGFLFDEDALGPGRDPAEAEARWEQLIEDAPEEDGLEPVRAAAPTLSKFRVRAATPPSRRPPRPEGNPPAAPKAGSGFWVRLLSRL